MIDYGHVLTSGCTPYPSSGLDRLVGPVQLAALCATLKKASLSHLTLESELLSHHLTITTSSSGLPILSVSQSASLAMTCPRCRGRWRRCWRLRWRGCSHRAGWIFISTWRVSVGWGECFIWFVIHSIHCSATRHPRHAVCAEPHARSGGQGGLGAGSTDHPQSGWWVSWYGSLIEWFTASLHSGVILTTPETLTTVASLLEGYASTIQSLHLGRE